MSRRRRRNPRNIPPWVIQLAVYAGAGLLLYKFGGKLFGSLKTGLDDAAKKATAPIARAIVGTGDVRYADGITYTLPEGTRINAQITQPLGGALFSYKGLRYKLVAADPPGSGNYKAERA